MPTLTTEPDVLLWRCNIMISSSIRDVQASINVQVLHRDSAASSLFTSSSSQLTLAVFVCQAKKKQEKEAASELQKAETKPNEPRSPAAQVTLNVSKTNATGGKRGGQVQRRSRKQHAVPTVKPPGGNSTKEQTKWAFFKCIWIWACYLHCMDPQKHGEGEEYKLVLY